jgi:RNA-directed DNA polymerase
MASKLRQIRAQLRDRLHVTLAETAKWLQSVVRGYLQYHAVPGNEERLIAFRKDVMRSWLRQLRRRSQRHRWTWERFLAHFSTLLPEVQILHPYPDVRFNANHPR